MIREKIGQLKSIVLAVILLALIRRPRPAHDTRLCYVCGRVRKRETGCVHR